MAKSPNVEILNLKECADELGRVSARLLDYRLNHWKTLSLAENLALEAQERDLDTKANQLIEKAVLVIAAGAKNAQTEIASATQKAADFIQTIKDTEIAIQVAASVVSLGIAIMAGQPAGILSAAAAVKKAAKPKQ
jgi:Tol biopolymer transport system component